MEVHTGREEATQIQYVYYTLRRCIHILYVFFVKATIVWMQCITCYRWSYDEPMICTLKDIQVVARYE